MKTSASLHLLPFQAEDILKTLGQRVSSGRRMHGLTQQDLAAKAGISMRTMVGIEKGLPTIQFGFWLSVLWALDMLNDFSELTKLGQDARSTALLEEYLPKRIRVKRSPTVA